MHKSTHTIGGRVNGEDHKGVALASFSLCMYDMCEFRRRHYSPSVQKGSKNKYKQNRETTFIHSVVSKRIIPVSKWIQQNKQTQFSALEIRDSRLEIKMPIWRARHSDEEKSTLNVSTTTNCYRKCLKYLSKAGREGLNNVNLRR